jgi:sirohydrochlorin cobaltochelatase
MPGEIRDFLANFLRRGACLIGQVRVGLDYSLRHSEDTGGAPLDIFSDPHDAIEIAKYDDAGKYRPLKTAPNLRHGWLLRLKNLDEVVLALDFLYPAALGTAWAFSRGELKVVNLRETLARQTGMYAIVKKITDAQAESVVTNTCNHQSGCMRHILWMVSPGRPTSLTRRKSDVPSSENEVPLLCSEACNLLVAAGRKSVKTSNSKRDLD